MHWPHGSQGNKQLCQLLLAVKLAQAFIVENLEFDNRPAEHIIRAAGIPAVVIWVSSDAARSLHNLIKDILR
jgi:hypothetical protein